MGTRMNLWMDDGGLRRAVVGTQMKFWMHDGGMRRTVVGTQMKFWMDQNWGWTCELMDKLLDLPDF